MKAVAAPGPGQPHPALPLNIDQPLLGSDCGGVKDGMGVVKFSQHLVCRWLTRRIKGDDHRLAKWQGLQLVDQVGNPDRLLARLTLAGKIVPC